MPSLLDISVPSPPKRTRKQAEGDKPRKELERREEKRTSRYTPPPPEMPTDDRRPPYDGINIVRSSEFESFS